MMHNLKYKLIEELRELDEKIATRGDFTSNDLIIAKNLVETLHHLCEVKNEMNGGLSGDLEFKMKKSKLFQ